MAELFAASKAEALYNPVTITDGMKLKEYLPPDVLEMLNPFWHNFPPESPLYYYLFALVYIVGGNQFAEFSSLLYIPQNH